MKCKWKIGCSLIGSLVLSSTPAMALPALNGSWRVTYFEDPARNAPQTFCIAFTTVANTIAGEPLSGTWVQPTGAPGAAPTWRGNWVQQGDQVKWWGNEFNFFSSHQGSLITSDAASGSMTGQYQWFQPVIGSLPAGATSIGAWSAQKAASCP